MSKPELELIGADGNAFMILGFKVRHKRTFLGHRLGYSSQQKFVRKKSWR